VSLWVSDIRSRFYASRNAFIYRLYLLWGYGSQTEIGNLFEPKLDKRTISKVTTEFTNVKTVVTSDFYQKHKPISEICSYHKIDEPLAWAIILEGKTDEKRCIHQNHFSVSVLTFFYFNNFWFVTWIFRVFCNVGKKE